jgi:flavin reductase (DIM6/NTAB) family NADH-FMN oxidoreductase RutF
MATVDGFKEVMSRWATGISVITTAYEDDWRGITANSFASVSIDPLLISMSVSKTLYTLEMFQKSGIFAVNVLRESQLDLGKRFAGMIPEFNEKRFEGLGASLSKNGSPILPDVLGWMDCRVYKQLDVGASILFLGEVTDAAFSDGEPLVYFHRQWGGFRAQG